MPALDRLKAKLEDLEEEYSDVRDKRNFLKKERLIKTDSEAKYELEQRIAECNEKLKEIEKEIDTTEDKINHAEIIGNADDSHSFDWLYKSLLKLGYWEQQYVFDDVTSKHTCGAFLIRGHSKEYGQRWLLKRLASTLPSILSGKKIIVDLKRTSSETNISAIWKDFAFRSGLSEEASPTEISQRICALRKSKDVLIVFDNVDETVKENLQNLLNTFWKSVAKDISRNNDQEDDFKLLIFFLDYQGIVTPWNVGFVEEFDSRWQPEHPLGLPEIQAFSARDLREWLNYKGDSLPLTLSQNKAAAVEMILEARGIPVFTLGKICNLCGCDWSDQEGEWLSL